MTEDEVAGWHHGLDGHEFVHLLIYVFSWISTLPFSTYHPSIHLSTHLCVQNILSPVLKPGTRLCRETQEVTQTASEVGKRFPMPDAQHLKVTGASSVGLVSMQDSLTNTSKGHLSIHYRSTVCGL